MKRWLIKLYLILLILVGGRIILSCSTKIAGAGSETTNGIVGCIVNEDGSPARATVVKLLPSDYDPISNAYDSSLVIDTTDNEGIFKFRNVKKGEYSIIARNYQCGTSVLIPLVKVEKEEYKVNISQHRLLKGGIITVDFKESKSLLSGYLYIPGTDIFAFIDTSDYVKIKDIPAGEFGTLIHNAGGKRNNILRKVVTVKPESTTIVPYPYWNYERRIILNTTEKGAGINENVYGFPVLIRLNENNFDFTKASSNGSDLRFTKTNGDPLPFEIERWNISQKQGEIWVRVDTIYGNDSLQSIVMYWGNSSIVTQPYERGLVFDTANGFRGVWHLSDTAKDTVRDATYNHFDGISTKNSSPSVTDGIIGDCRYFNGSSNYITIPNSADGKLDFSQNDRYTVSAWVYLENFDGLSRVVLSKGNLQYFLWVTPIHLNTTLWEFANYRDGSGWDLAAGPAVAGEWVFLTGVRDGTMHKLYINGEPAKEFIDFPFAEPRNTDSDLLIGRLNQRMASPNDTAGEYCFFKGKIDEVRICGIVRSPAWIKLCYMNQKKEDKLVIFK